MTTPIVINEDSSVQVTILDNVPVAVQVVQRSQNKIQFQDEGVNVGTAGTVSTINFEGAAVTVSRVGNVVTITITGGSGSGWAVTGQTDLTGTVTVLPTTDGAQGLVFGSTAKRLQGLVVQAGIITLNAEQVAQLGFSVAGIFTRQIAFDTTGTKLILGSDAEGDLYYRGATYLTRLAKGTALQVLRMNAGATAPEWAAGGSGWALAGETPLTAEAIVKTFNDTLLKFGGDLGGGEYPLEIAAGRATLRAQPLIDGEFAINNPAGTFAYTIKPAAITANRDLNLPLTTATDTLLSRLGLPFTCPEFFGAVGDGATNDAVAIQAAIDASSPTRPVYLMNKNYRITTGLNLPATYKIFGGGQNSIISSTTAITSLTLNGKNTVDGIQFLGSDNAGLQVGIRVSDTTGATSTKHTNFISNCKFTDCRYGLNAAEVYGSNYEGAFQAVNCAFQSNSIGCYIEAGAEYCELTGCIFTGNVTGFRTDGGNNKMTGGHITGNTTGFHATAGGNNGKFRLTGVHINHNTTAVLLTGIANVGRIESCGIFGGILNLTDSFVIFSDCEFSDGAPATWTITNSSGLTQFHDCKFLYTPTITLSGTKPIFIGCNWATLPTLYGWNTMYGALVIDGHIAPTALSGNTDDYAPTGIITAAVLRISSSAGNINLTGIDAGVGMISGRRLRLINEDTVDTITLKNDVTSTAANRFLMPADFPMLPNSIVDLERDATASRWRMVGYYSGSAASNNPVTLYKNTAYTTHASTSELVIDFFSIPAGTILANDKLEIRWAGQKTLVNGAANLRIMISATLPVIGNAPPSSVNIGIATSGTWTSGIRFVRFKRDYEIVTAANSHFAFPTASSAFTDEGSATSDWTNLTTVDLSAQAYLLVTMQNGSALDTVIQRSFQVIRIRP